MATRSRPTRHQRREIPAAWRPHVQAWQAALRACDDSEGTITLWTRYVARLAEANPDGPWTVTRRAIVAFLGAHDGWTANTRRSARSGIRSFYDWAYGDDEEDCIVPPGPDGRPPRNPAARLPRVKVPKGTPRPAPDDVIAEAILRASERTRVMILIASILTARRAEVAVIHRDDMVRGPKGWNLTLHGKGKKDRTIHVPSHLAPILLDRFAKMQRETGSKYLFPSGASHLTPAYVGKLMRRVLPGQWTPHTLRHAAATSLYASGLGLVELAQVMGHDSTEQTQRYTQGSEEATIAAIEAVAEKVLTTRHLRVAGTEPAA